jgi:hypothetical protein
LTKLALGESETTYKANLQRVGTVIPETITLMGLLAHSHNWSEVKELALKNNLLKKRSSYTINSILSTFKQRFLANDSDLPDALDVAKVLSKELPLSAKAQVLLPYVCKADKLISDLILHLVLPNLEKTNAELFQDDVVSFLDEEGKEHTELRRWSDYLRKRWARGFLALLRDFGFMEAVPSNRLVRPVVRVEVFTFFLLGMVERGLNIRRALDNDLWNYYAIDAKEKEELLKEAQIKGWVHFLKAGEIVEISLKYSTLGAWLDALGQ